VALGILGIAGLIALGACGDIDRHPFDSTEVTAEPIGDSALSSGGVLVFSPRALMTSAAKKVSGAEDLKRAKKVKKTFRSARNGNMTLWFPKYGDDRILRVKKATFSVKKNSIAGAKPNRKGNYRISMEVTTGTKLDDIVIRFTPSGMAFKPKAKLKLLLKGTMDVGGARKLATGPDDEDDSDLADEADEGEEAFIYHVSKGGVTKVPVKVKVKKSGFLLTIRVPGFSDWQWDDMPEGDGP
jgi:hypothetical protein